MHECVSYFPPNEGLGEFLFPEKKINNNVHWRPDTALLYMLLSNLRIYIFVAVFFQMTMRQAVQVLPLMSSEGLG